MCRCCICFAALDAVVASVRANPAAASASDAAFLAANTSPDVLIAFASSLLILDAAPESFLSASAS